MNNMFDVSKATTAELVNYFNAHSGKSPIKKFADRKTAEKRVAALVPAKKTLRSAVLVAGTEYRSVRQAFEHLKLPLGRHINFRMKLKAAGNLTFEHDGKTFSFKVVS